MWSMYLAVDYLGILLNRIHQELHLPPLFFLPETIPLKSISFFFFQREWVYLLLKG